MAIYILQIEIKKPVTALINKWLCLIAEKDHCIYMYKQGPKMLSTVSEI